MRYLKFSLFPGSALQGYFFVCCWFSSPFFYVPLFSGYRWRDHSGKLLVLVSWLCAEETGGAESWRSLSRAEQIKGRAVGRHTALWPPPWPWPPGWPPPPPGARRWSAQGSEHWPAVTSTPAALHPLLRPPPVPQRWRVLPGGEKAFLRMSVCTAGLLVCFLIR